ncbi:MAG: leishmanolysin-related zinc metalloendopeptidase [Gemmataceae bacterium]
MKSSHQFTPEVEALDDRIALATVPITLGPVLHPALSSNIVMTLPTPQAPPVVPTDDSYEDNDTRVSAFNLATLSGTQNSTATRALTGLMLEDSADWFKFTMTQKGVAGCGVSIRFSNAEGNLNLRLYDSSGKMIGASLGTGDVEAITLAGRAAGTYYVQVRGAYGAHNPEYTLAVKQAILTGGPTTPVIPPTVPPNVPVIPPPPTDGFNITLRFGTGLTASQQFVFQQAANRWGQIIIGDLPAAVYQGIAVDDLLIDASAIAIDGVGGVLGQAAPDTFRTTGAFLPIHGFMQFDTADLSSLEASGELYSVILHEMAHVLGFGTIWQTKLLLVGAGSTDPRYIGARAVAEYNAIFGTSVAGIPLENTGGPGTADSHWRESVFGAELMTGFLDPGVPNPLSRVTVASMGDLGYTVNMLAAEPYVP